MAGAEPSDMLWIVISGAGAALLGAIGKLWALTVEQRKTIERITSENFELTTKLHAEHKADLRGFIMTKARSNVVEMRDIPWAPSLPPSPLPEPPPPDVAHRRKQDTLRLGVRETAELHEQGVKLGRKRRPAAT